jgi:hypothetical protein
MHAANVPPLPMKTGKEELRDVKHVIKELSVAFKGKDIRPFPFGLHSTVLRKERVSDGVAKAIERSNVLVEFVWETNSGSDELQFLQYG